MRHGRKSKSRTFHGYKSHLASDVDTKLILACDITPANRHEADALPAILEDLGRYRERNELGELHIDRGVLNLCASCRVRGQVMRVREKVAA